MIEELREKLPQIEALCRKYGVLRLELFGSAARGDFDREQSDVDCLVKFAPEGDLSPARRYFGLIADLEQLMGRNVHVAEDFDAQNPEFLKRIQPDLKALYAA